MAAASIRNGATRSSRNIRRPRPIDPQATRLVTINAGRSERTISTSPRRAAPSITNRRAINTGLAGAMDVPVWIRIFPVPEKT
jgi:hypothetical protein